MFCVILALLVMVIPACQTSSIPNGEVCMEIPFVDAPEGACIETVTHKESLIGAAEWAKRKPFMLSIGPEFWAKIKTNWLEACRMAGPDCTTQVDSIAGLIEKLDKIAGAVIQP